MGRFIIKIQEYYLEWSTIVDAPITYGLKLEDFNAYYRDMYGSEGMRGLDERLQRVEACGTSARDWRKSVEDVIGGNHAGEKETELTLDQIYEKYCAHQYEDSKSSMIDT